MDIKDLNKKQLILLTLLITFIVSIATGIVTVSLMNKMPAKTTQTINNVIQRTIEKVVAPTTDTTTTQTSKSMILGESEALVNIYPAPKKIDSTSSTNTPTTPVTAETKDAVKSLGQGIIISDNGLILVESSILTGEIDYVVILNKEFFSLKVIKKFGNGFAILGITSKTNSFNIADESKKDTTPTNDLSANAIESTPVDKPLQ